MESCTRKCILLIFCNVMHNLHPRLLDLNFYGNDGNCLNIYDMLQPGPLREETQHLIPSSTCHSMFLQIWFFIPKLLCSQTDRQTVMWNLSHENQHGYLHRAWNSQYFDSYSIKMHQFLTKISKSVFFLFSPIKLHSVTFKPKK